VALRPINLVKVLFVSQKWKMEGWDGKDGEKL